MLFHAKAGGQRVIVGLDAAVDFVDLATIATAEVIVMVLAGELIAQALARQFYHLEGPLLGQVLDAAVDGSNT